MQTFSNYRSVLEHLDRLGLFHMDLTLDRMREFVQRLGGVPGYPVVHVVGTNGKGSTASMVERLAREHDLCTGLYTSPHFLTPRERVLVDGCMLSEEEWTHLANRVADAGEGLGLTYFEFLTCLALLAFDDAEVDVAVMEAGLGGRYGATRVLDPDLVLFTSVGLDHTAQLGPDLFSIADDKSHAMVEGGHALTAPQRPEVMEVFRTRALEVGARFQMAPPLPPGSLSMPGVHQLANGGLALAGWQQLAIMLDRDTDPWMEANALREVRVPGRCQVEPGEPTLVLDGAHNPQGLSALADCLADMGLKPDVLIFACMRDKPLDEMLPLAETLADHIILPRLEEADRAMDPGELAAMLGETATVAEDVAQALEMAGTGTVLVCGSLYLLAEVFRIIPEAWPHPD